MHDEGGVPVGMPVRIRYLPLGIEAITTVAREGALSLCLFSRFRH